jgi:Cu(I)/Ag(I) efflux system membrane protein CusA/SilA
MTDYTPTPQSILGKLIWFCLTHKLVIFLGLFIMIGWGVVVSPFNLNFDIPVRPVRVDAIPDIGENQQIVFTKWPGRSPQDVEDQITYPLTVALLGVPEVKSVRSFSMFGFSSIYVVFNDATDFYWSRARILETLNTLSPDDLPSNVRPTLGPDATAMGQVFWYTVEGRDKHGAVTGGWDLGELRQIQDWHIKHALRSADGVSEVAAIGGFTTEYQIDVNPDLLTHYNIKLKDVFKAVRQSNQDIGAKTIEINRAEYIIRGIGFIKTIEDIENTVIKTVENTPIYVKQVANVIKGPGLRRGVLDKAGTEVVGGVVITRYGQNPLETISHIKQKIKEIEPGLPEKILPDGTRSKLKIIPFYDRATLIHDTLNTLKRALSQQVLITIIVVLLLIFNFRSAILISIMLPLSVLIVFIAMKQFGVEANIVALSGIAIAIGTIVDMGIVMIENIRQKLESRSQNIPTRVLIYNAACEMGPALITAISTTLISFIPIFTMTGAEGKLFKPLAFTKTIALLASVILAIVLLPALSHLMMGKKNKWSNHPLYTKLHPFKPWLNYVLIGIATIYLTQSWLPFGAQHWFGINVMVVSVIIAGILGSAWIFQRHYETLLSWCLINKKSFLAIPVTIIMAGIFAWASLGKEFMPTLDEGAFLYMPTTMAHASIEEVTDILQKQDQAISQIPEVETVVGKLGRVDSALDPAPISMIETIIQYKPEFRIDETGNHVRNWRDHIKTPDDIWNAIQTAAQIPGTTTAPKLQPIAARVVMLQSGIRAPMAIQIKGSSLDSVSLFGKVIESHIKSVKEVAAETVFADRVVNKPYYEIHIDRNKIARHGIRINDVQDTIEMAIGGKVITHTIEGRERYPIRIRYQREYRDHLDTLNHIGINSPQGARIPLSQLATIRFFKGPQVIKSEDTFLTSFVLFDKNPDMSEMDTIDAVKTMLKEKIDSGEITVPRGVSYEFTGNYKHLVRSEKTLQIILPLSLALIFIILYLQFRSIQLTSLVFSGVFLAWSGGFILIWLYGQAWFLNIPLIGHFLRDLFQIQPVHLSVAVWVGFLALFGIATDDGVMMGTFLKQSFNINKPTTRTEIHRVTIRAGKRRVRPCIMTTATTMLALIPVLTASGKGAGIMVPMALPSFGGMFVAMITLITVPVLYAWLQERALSKKTANFQSY